jgi:two-component system chemotaxis sensor kinase CheA
MTSLTEQIREQIISSFRSELVEHIQTMNAGLLAVEQGNFPNEDRATTLQTTFRAAHSLKGAARAVGVTIIEQMAHTLESVLDALQKDRLQPSQDLFTRCYKTLDAIQAVQHAYESGETTPPISATQAMLELEQMLSQEKPVESKLPTEEPRTEAVEIVESQPKVDAPEKKNDRHGKKANSSQRVKSAFRDVLRAKEEADQPVEQPVVEVVPVQPVQPPPPVANETDASRPPKVERRSAASESDLLRVRATDGETVRVKVNRLDTLMDHLNELLILKIRSQQRFEQIKSAKTLIDNLEKEWQVTRGAYAHRLHSQSNDPTHVSKDEKKILYYASFAQEHVHTTSQELSHIAHELASDISQMSLAIDELEMEVKSLRMLPLSTITAAFPRMVRDLAKNYGKDVTLQIRGADTELDKHVIEQIKDPLIHLLRNAVDHGVEMPEDRLAVHKPAMGAITLLVEQIGKDVIIKVTDDGAGLDMDALRRSVEERGVDASAMSEGELQRYIFEPGITTSNSVTDISGRGIGLDIVRKNLEELQGTCEVSSVAGQGTTFILTIPLRVTGSRGLMIKTSSQLYAIPISMVEHILSIQQKNIASLEGHEVIYHNEQPVALLWLCDVLDLPRVASLNNNSELPVIILKNAEHRIAFIVDELAGEQEIVVKALGDQLMRIVGLAGATILGTGEVVLILDAKDLIAMAMKGGYTAAMKQPVSDKKAEQAKPTRHILVVDDSITTRTLEKNILEAAGYAVQLATDGQEALNIVGAGFQPDIIISDVSMPRVGGLELARRIKSNPQTSQLPIVLVSSNDSAEDKMRGMEAGADAYISKGSFDQNNLLETIEMIITNERA